MGNLSPLILLWKDCEGMRGCQEAGWHGKYEQHKETLGYQRGLTPQTGAFKKINIKDSRRLQSHRLSSTTSSHIKVKWKATVFQLSWSQLGSALASRCHGMTAASAPALSGSALDANLEPHSRPTKPDTQEGAQQPVLQQVLRVFIEDCCPMAWF